MPLDSVNASNAHTVGRGRNRSYFNSRKPRVQSCIKRFDIGCFISGNFTQRAEDFGQQIINLLCLQGIHVFGIGSKHIGIFKNFFLQPDRFEKIPEQLADFAHGVLFPQLFGKLRNGNCRPFAKSVHLLKLRAAFRIFERFFPHVRADSACKAVVFQYIRLGLLKRRKRAFYISEYIFICKAADCQIQNRCHKQGYGVTGKRRFSVDKHRNPVYRENTFYKALIIIDIARND